MNQERFEIIMRERDLGSLKKDPYTGVYLTERTAMAWEVWKACSAQQAKAEPIKLPSTRTIGVGSEYIRGLRDYFKAVQHCLERQGYRIAFEDELDRLAAQEPKA